MLTNLLFTPEFFIKWYYQPTDSFFIYILRKEISRDTISLLILMFGEVGFYYLFLNESIKEGKESIAERNKDSGK
jgi:hypothetical protein